MSLAEGRALRRERWLGLFPPWALAATGAAVSAAFLFQRSLPVRAAMFLCFLGAALLAGKRVSLFSLLVVSASVVAANLLVPVGKVLAVLGPLKITRTALLDGIGKALVLEGLIFVSKASILPGLRLPGRFGSLVAAAFVYYDRIVEYKGKVKPATLIADADRLMLEIWDDPAAGPEPAAPRPLKAGAAVALGSAVLAAYLPLFFRA